MKLKSILSIALLAVSLIPATAFAENVKQADPATQTLTSYLKAAEKGDIDSIIAYSTDNRFTAEDEKKEVYKKSIQNDGKINKFEVLEKTVIDNNKVNFIAKLSFQNGSIAQVPFYVVNNNNNWKVEISSDSLDANLFKELSPATAITPSEEVHANAQVCNWDFEIQGQGTTFYSNCTFDINTTNSQVLFNLQQWSDSNVKETPNIKYEIVKEHWYGDDSWGYTYAYGTITPYGQQFQVTGKSNTFSGAKIKFKTNSTSSNYVTFAGFGELYD